MLTYVVSFVLRFFIKFDTCQKVSASDIEIEKLWKQSRNLSRQFEPLSAVSRKEHMSEQVNLMLKSSGDKIGILNRHFEPLRTVAKRPVEQDSQFGDPVVQEGRFGTNLGRGRHQKPAFGIDLVASSCARRTVWSQFGASSCVARKLGCAMCVSGCL